MSLTEPELIVLLAGSPAGTCSLNESPRKNWVEKNGGLPNYICQIAKGILKGSKMDKSAAIATAISRTKVWAAGGAKVHPDTRAKAAAAVAEWAKLRASAAAGHVVKASRDDGSPYFMLSAPDVAAFNTDIVRQAWSSVQTQVRSAIRAKAAAQAAAGQTVDPDGDGDDDSAILTDEDAIPYGYIRELWTDHIIVEADADGGIDYYSIPYTVSGTSVTFGTPQEVEQSWTPVDEATEADDDAALSPNELALLADVFEASATQIGNIEALAKLGVAHDGGALDQVITLTRR